MGSTRKNDRPILFSWMQTACVVVVLFYPSESLYAQETKAPISSRPNLEIFQQLIGTMTGEIVQQSHLRNGDTLRVLVASHPDGWIAQHAILSTLKSAGYIVYGETHDVQPILLDIKAVELHVRYDDMFREGFLGNRKVRRTILAGLSFQNTNQRTGEVLSSGMLSEHATDTVSVDDISSLELGSTGSTHAEVPSGSLFDRVLEPFIIIGATGVAVYLFFHVRS